MSEEVKTTAPWEGAEEVKANWFQFPNVGDKIKGTLLNKYFQRANIEGYQDQWIYELKNEEGEVWNVGIPASKSGTIQRLNRCKVGEIVGILFEKEIPATSKGKKPAKALKVFTFGMDENYFGEEVQDSSDENLPEGFGN